MKAAIKSLESKESREKYRRLRRAEKLFLQAAEQAGNNKLVRFIQSDDDEEDEVDNEKELQYSLKSDFADEIQNWFATTTSEERAKSGKRFLLGSTTDVLKSIGVKECNIYFGGSKINTILEGNESMTLDIIKQAVNLLEDPILIMESVTVDNSIVIFGEVYTTDGKPVMISVLYDPKNKNGEILDYAVITSAYGRRIGNLQNLINKSKIYYINEQKNRTDKWLKALGLQLPSAITKYGSINIIPKNPEKSTPEVKKSKKIQPTYAGNKSKTANHSLLAQAQELEAKGVDSEEIRQKTGWFRSYDKLWRYEISDSKMKLLKRNILEGELPLGELIEHEELFRAYPELRDLRVVIFDGGNRDASYELGEFTITMSNKCFDGIYGWRVLLAHEIQHAIQEIEGFALGSSDEYWEGFLNKKIFDKEDPFIDELKGRIKTAREKLMDNGQSEIETLAQEARGLPDDEEGERKYRALENEAINLGAHSEFVEYSTLLNALDFEYASIYERVKRNAMTANLLNALTAGELEAKDVGNRMYFTDEQRKNTRPDIDEPDVVFADHSDVLASPKLVSEGKIEEPVTSINEEKLQVSENNKTRAFSESTVWGAIGEAFDHQDEGDDNLILVSKMPRYITEKFGIEGDMYIYRDHAYENMVSEEDAIAAGRKTTRGRRKIHFHNLGMQKMADALLSIENPVMTIDDTLKEGNPKVVMILPEFGNNDAPLYAVLSFYSDTPINGILTRKPHIVLTVAERDFFGTEDRPGWSELISKAIEENRVLDYNKNEGHTLTVIAQHTRLGNITEASLNNSISQFLKKINTFKQKKKIQYSRKASTDGAAAKPTVNIPLLNRTQFKIYTKENAEQIISSIAFNTLSFNDGTQGVIKNKGELVDLMWRRLNSTDEGKRGGVALDLAEEVLKRVAVKAIYDDPNNAQYVETVSAIKEYMQSFNLDAVRSELEHRFGKNKARGIMLAWGAKNGERGISADSVAQELTGQGIVINAENEADAFFEIHDLYSRAREALKRRSEAMLDTVIPEDERNELKQAIAKEILEGFYVLGKKSMVMNMLEQQEANAKIWKEQYYDSKNRAKAIDHLFETVDRVRNIVDMKKADEEIAEEVEKAYTKENTDDYKKYAEASDELIKEVSDELDISGYSHALRDNDIRHINLSHGEGNPNEKYPVTREDIKAIPTIVNSYDKVIVFRKSPQRVGLMYVKVMGDGLVYYLEQVTDIYGNEKLLVNKQMIKTGISDIPDIKGLISAITKKQSETEFLADLKARQVYAQSVYQSHSNGIIPENAEFVNTTDENNQRNALQVSKRFDSNKRDIRYSYKSNSGESRTTINTAVNLPLLNRSQFKIYTKENAEQIISGIAFNTLNFNDGTQGVIKNKGELVDLMWRRLNSTDEGKRGGEALDFADFEKPIVKDADGKYRLLFGYEIGHQFRHKKYLYTFFARFKMLAIVILHNCSASFCNK